MRLLVVGADRVDAGKTTFSVGLLDRIGGVGIKPRAGNDAWFDYDDVREAVTEGRLYGNDARRLAAASAVDLDPEAINPVHRLWRPLPGPDTGMIGAGRRQFVCDRVGSLGIDQSTVPAEGLVVNEGADVPGIVREGLPVEEARTVRSVDVLDRITAETHGPAVEALADRIERYDRVVIESYADVARPLPTVDVDVVAAVEPGRVRIYDGERYDRACSVASSSLRDGQLEQAVEDVLDPLDPLASTRLPALQSDDRSSPGAIADAYEVAYDALLGAAVG